MPAQFENGMRFDDRNSLQDFDAKEADLHHKSLSVSFQTCLKMFYFHHFEVSTRFRFQTVSVRCPFSKSTVFKMCRHKKCRFRVNVRPIRRIFHRFQNVPASCERSLRPRLHEIGSKWIRTQTVTDRPCVYTGHDGSEPIWICYPYPSEITFESDPVWIRSQKGLV